jgi:glycosyltransferase involved in cell wall biosynthesis
MQRDAIAVESVAPKSSPLPITAIVMTYNEERNLRACLESVRPWVEDIFVVDSFSTDRTLAMAAEYGCVVEKHPFRNQAEQFQWALDTLRLRTEWVLRLDADERWTAEGFRELRTVIADPRINGVSVRRRIMFMGRWMKHGGLYASEFVRVFRRGHASVERRWMDEHLHVSGKIASSHIEVIEANYDRQENVAVWTTKHNDYSTREAIDMLLRAEDPASVDSIADLRGDKTARKRWLKENVYGRAPLFVRPIAYFVYRYFFKLGFLDGVPGLIFNVLQGFWYRFLVDVKVYQLQRHAASTGKSIKEVIAYTYGVQA